MTVVGEDDVTKRNSSSDDPVVWFLRGASAEFDGDIDRACAFYLKALTLMDQRGRREGQRGLTGEIKDIAAHARLAIQSQRRVRVMSDLDRLEAAYGRREIQRVRRAFAVYLGDEAADLAPSQKPAFLYFPGIRVDRYYDPAEFAWAPALRDQWTVIAREAWQVMSRHDGVESFSDQDRSPLKVLIPGWQAFFFYRYGRRFDDSHRLCPNTSAMLEKVPLCHVPGHAPETLFSVLTPHGDIRPHRGMTNTRLVAHLPLIVPEPNNCWLNVAGVEHRWHEGELVVFDDTFLHSACNQSDKFRVVLLMDIWHPDLTEIERLALSDMIGSCMRFGANLHDE